MALGVWHFAAKSHIDVKRVYSQFGNIVSDTTVRKALNSMTGSSLVFSKLGQQEQQYSLMIANLVLLIYRVTLHASPRRSRRQ
jgi:hypothetical protein